MKKATQKTKSNLNSFIHFTAQLSSRPSPPSSPSMHAHITTSSCSGPQNKFRRVFCSHSPVPTALANCRLFHTTQKPTSQTSAAAGSATQMTVEQDTQQQPPAVYKRLVAKRTGGCFSEVAEVEEVPMLVPAENEVHTVVRATGRCKVTHNFWCLLQSLAIQSPAVLLLVPATVSTCSFSR